LIIKEMTPVIMIFTKEYWMELLFETGYIPENDYKPLQNQCGQIRRVLISSLNTTKANQSNI